MKQKRVSLTILIALIIMIALSAFSTVYASHQTGSMYLKIELLRSSGFGYKALEKNIWKICETNSSGTTKSYDKTIYCLKGGPGFGSSVFGSGTPEMRHYTEYFDMKDTATIESPYSDALPGFTSTTTSTEYKDTSVEYKSLIWLLENVYIAPKTNASTEDKNKAAEYKEILLENANIDGGYITDEDIDAVQQLAVWHFTNTDSYKVPDGETFELWINSLINDSRDSTFNPLSDEIGDGAEYGADRAEECQALYDYLVNTATQMGENGYTPKVSTDPYKIAEYENRKVKIEDNNYIIGPFEIEVLDENASATFVGTIKNGNTEINPTLQDANGNKFNSLEDTFGKQFFIVLPTTTKLDTISLSISGVYYETSLQYWAVEDAPSTEQPVVLVERKQKEYSYSEEVEPKEFDLSLRKYIVSINGELVDISRKPVIDTSPLQNGTDTTANKMHPKNALIVKTGDKVIYRIEVYNEGEIDGYATEITDYLPDGLKITNSEINNKWSNPSNDGKTYTTDALAGTKLNAYDGGDVLTSAYVDVECEVIATADSNMSLRNVAEISKDENEDGIPDRDSIPDNVKEHFDTLPEDDEDYEIIELEEEEPEKEFDLSLRKYIVSINGKTVDISREPEIDPSPLQNGTNTTAIKNHPKNALTVKTGDKVIYRIEVYNEGEIDGYATEITDYLPDGLKITDSEINSKWSNPSNDGKTYTTDVLAGTELKAYDGGEELDSAYVDIECEVIATTKQSDTSLRNVAEISEDKNEEGIPDRDSIPGNVKEHFDTLPEDDEDYEQLVIPGEYFDLSLRKYIEGVNDVAISNDEGKIREPEVDVTPLKNGEDTAIYKHPKEPVNVEVGDTVTYVIRVYNEGQIDGYVTEITDHLPKYLEYLNNEFNASYGWKISSDGRTATTTITSPNTEYTASRDLLYADRTSDTDKVLLKAFDGEKLDYIDVKIQCKVKDTGIAQKITNIAEISGFTDENSELITDRDSQEDNFQLPTDEELPEYKDPEIESGKEYIPGRQDDDDFEKVIVQKFDLSLRKFITGVNTKEITNRFPIFSTDENKNYKYEHPKSPVEVVSGDTVIYTLRIFNEGNLSGYAKEIKDDLPEGLEYLPDNEINKEYRWKMYKADGTETDNVEEAVSIRTDYLSKEQEDATGRVNLIDAFDKGTMTMPDSKDVKIVFKVKEPNTSDRIIINTAEISDDSDEYGNPVEDVDSIPDNNEENEDDIDIEKIKVQYFDMSLKKIITQVSMKHKGKTTVTKTGHKFDQEPEPVVKVELGNSKINTAEIKFKYQIRVMNEGEVEGYVKEIRDYIPAGLKFVASDNKNWKLSDDGKTITTDQLKDTLLQPGESAIVEVTLQWINGQNNLGIKKNVAEISKDSNDYNDIDDIDSTPDNKVNGEDDIDDASVVLSIVTGERENYIIIIVGVLAILSTGIILIKKFVI